MTAPSLSFPTVEQAQVSVAKGWAVVDGAFSDDGAERAMQWMQRLSMKRGSDKFGIPYHQITNHPLLPPPEWVAAAEACADCRGRGWDIVRPLDDDDDVAKCPYCHGVGKPRVAVTAPCAGARYHGDESTCTGIRHVAWVTVTEVLPVVESLGSLEDPMPRVGVVTGTARNDGVYLQRRGEYPSADITADVAHLGAPEALIGKWLLRLQPTDPASPAVRAVDDRNSR